MTTLHDHLRQFLGEPTGGERVALDRVGHSIRLRRYDDQPAAGAVTVVTDGLSTLAHHALHEELLMMTWARELSTDLLLVLEYMSRQLAEGRPPLEYGDVIGPAGPLTPGSAMQALLVYEPVYLPDGSASFYTDDGCLIRLRWLIPLHVDEVRLIEELGVAWFEQVLEAEDPDLLSLRRAPLIRPRDEAG